MATEQQIPKLAGSLVEHQSGFAALSTDDAQWAIGNTKEAIGLFVEAVKNRATKVKEKLLEHLFTRQLLAIKEFVARDRFIVDTSDTTELPISDLGSNFKNWFLGKVEKNVGACEAKVSKLLKRSLDKPILDELGDTAEKALAHVYEFLKSADHSVCYIFYVNDVNGVLRAVGAGWFGGGWYVSADSVESPDGWYGGSQVVSR